MDCLLHHECCFRISGLILDGAPPPGAGVLQERASKTTVIDFREGGISKPAGFGGWLPLVTSLASW